MSTRSIVSIDHYAEKALGNRSTFISKLIQSIRAQR